MSVRAVRWKQATGPMRLDTPGGGDPPPGDGGVPVVAALATLAEVDSDGDTYSPDAFRDATLTPAVVSAWGHGSEIAGQLPVGEGRVVTQGGKALFRGVVWSDTAGGADLIKVLARRAGRQQWSFALADMRSRPVSRGGRGVNLIESVRVPEVSPVLRGAGVGTSTLALGDLDVAEIEKAREHVRQYEMKRMHEQLQMQILAARCGIRV